MRIALGCWYGSRLGSVSACAHGATGRNAETGMMYVEQVAALGAGPRWLSDGRAMELPYLIRDFAGIGGKIKQRPEDFFVQELPLYEPSGEGEHLYVEIQKVKLSTFEAVNRLARACGVSPHDIGYAGMKDTFAVT